MKKISLFLLVILVMIPALVSAQSYDELWKSFKEANNKDLPQTCLQVLDKITKKAENEKSYVHLLKAELTKIEVRYALAPFSAVDSAEVWCNEMKARALKLDGKDKVAAAIMNLAIHEAQAEFFLKMNDSTYLKKAFADKDLLANTKADNWSIILDKKVDSKVFNNDMFSAMGVTIGEYQMLYDYYKAHGNRPACVALLRSMNKGDAELIEEYKDVPECAYLAKNHLGSLTRSFREFNDSTYQVLQVYRKHWAGTNSAGVLDNIQRNLMSGSFEMLSVPCLIRSNHEVTLPLTASNINKVVVSIVPLSVDGKDVPEQDVYDSADEFYKRVLNKYASKSGGKYKGEISFTKDILIKNCYTQSKDTIVLPKLKTGVYYLKIEDKSNTDAAKAEGFEEYNQRNALLDEALLYVSDLRIISLGLADKQSRNVVVDAVTGHEVKDAKILYKDKKSSWCAYSPTDKGMPYMRKAYSSYSKYDPEDEKFVQAIYTDRGIYRPGQTVHVATVLHKVIKGCETEVAPNERVTISLRTPNYKDVATKTVTTDDYGTATVDFVIPQGELTGSWNVSCRGRVTNSQSIRVEEYKRPTFDVSFDDYKGEYQLGDTIRVKGKAKTYSGVPVAGAKVAYAVTRALPWWWTRYINYNDDDNGSELLVDTIQTDDSGEFEVVVPLIAKDVEGVRAYSFNVKASVTSLAGETHEGSYSVSASNKKYFMNISVDKKFRKDVENIRLYCTVRNASGKEIEDAKVTYKLDGKSQTYTSADDVKSAIRKLPSGRHQLTAAFEEERDTASFVIFSLDDAVPVEETPDWFYATATTFNDESDVVTLQFGSSCNDVDIFYDVFEGDEHLESTTLHCSNSLIKKEYRCHGKNVCITMAWMKDDELYTYSHQISKPLPKKNLKLSWSTFRNKLEPGQKEEWTLHIKNPQQQAGAPQLLACMYDKSLDAIYASSWGRNLGLSTGTLRTWWRQSSFSTTRLSLYRNYKKSSEYDPRYTKLNVWPFADNLISPMLQECVVVGYGVASATPGISVKKMAKLSAPAVKADMEVMSESAVVEDRVFEVVEQQPNMKTNMTGAVAEPAPSPETPAVQLRSNFSETAFFYPQLLADENGDVKIAFTLPESTTTWQFRAYAHDKAMNNGKLEDEIIAQKKLMISPNMPRFLRKSDKAVLASTVSNISEKNLNPVVKLQILDPATERVIFEKEDAVSLDAGKTAPVAFSFDTDALADAPSLLVFRITAVADNYSDGEQHYIALLDDEEPVMTTRVITLVKPSTEVVNTADLFPADAKEKKVTVEWTENPAWLMLETLPFLSYQDRTNVYSQAAAYYANALGSAILKSLPNAAAIFKTPVQNPSAVSSESALARNQELKTLLLNETPWVLESDNETERMQMLRNFYDENTLAYNQKQILDKLNKEQKSDGGWSWCPEMHTSYHMTSEICELFTRLNNMIGEQSTTRSMLNKAMSCLQKQAHKEIQEMKKMEKKGETIYVYDCYALQYVYLKALSGKELTSSERKDADFLIKYLKKQERKNSLYMKAKLAIVLYYMGEEKIANEYIQSIKEYSVYQELQGRYFDTKRAGYSWRNYKQPTQTMVIEALKTVTPDDRQTIAELQRWLLIQKRAQMWDTPINTVNNVYAFVNKTEGKASLSSALSSSDSSAEPQGKGYSKTTYTGSDIQPTYTFTKDNNEVSWGAVYAQFKQKAANVSDFSQGITVVREVVEKASEKAVGANASVAIGTKVKVRITINADQDYDFVQVVDKRAACLEPVNQLSGYRWNGGYYEAPQDSRTCYFFDQLRKGKHVIETEYYVDRAGDYHSGTCTAQCAYAPEFYGRTGGKCILIDN